MSKTNTILIAVAVALLVVFGILLTLLIIRVQNRETVPQQQSEPLEPTPGDEVITYPTLAPQSQNQEREQKQEVIVIENGTFDRRVWTQSPATNPVFSNKDNEAYTIESPNDQVPAITVQPGGTVAVTVRSGPSFPLIIRERPGAVIDIVPL